jgi:hypothetical protein
VEQFNPCDWDRLGELITAAALLLVADRFVGPLTYASCLGRYERLTTPWRMAVGEVDGQMAVVVLHQENGAWRPYSIVRVQTAGALIAQVVDYEALPLGAACNQLCCLRTFLSTYLGSIRAVIQAESQFPRRRKYVREGNN